MTSEGTLEKVRSEFKQMVRDSSSDAEADLAKLSRKELLRKYMTNDGQSELQYLN